MVLEVSQNHLYHTHTKLDSRHKCLKCTPIFMQKSKAKVLYWLMLVCLENVISDD